MRTVDLTEMIIKSVNYLLDLAITMCVLHFVLCSNERPMDAQMRYFGEVLLDKPGFGTRCMVDEPLE